MQKKQPDQDFSVRSKKGCRQNSRCGFSDTDSWADSSFSEEEDWICPFWRFDIRCARRKRKIIKAKKQMRLRNAKKTLKKKKLTKEGLAAIMNEERISGRKET